MSFDKRIKQVDFYRIDKKIIENLKSRFIQMEAGKLTEAEELQFVQDAVSCGYIWTLGPEMNKIATILLQAGKIKPPKSGYVGVDTPKTWKERLLGKKDEFFIH